jgi:hypothetical protein
MEKIKNLKLYTKEEVVCLVAQAAAQMMTEVTESGKDIDDDVMQLMIATGLRIKTILQDNLKVNKADLKKVAEKFVEDYE